MMSACELCSKITVENALHEEATRITKMQSAKMFAENIISPIIENLTEIPNHLKIGFCIRDAEIKYLYQGVSDWKKTYTHCGNPMESRYLIGQSENGYEMLDYEVLNQYLAEFGFQISTKFGWIVTDTYSTSTRDKGYQVDYLYLSMTCPIEVS